MHLPFYVRPWRQPATAANQTFYVEELKAEVMESSLIAEQIYFQDMFRGKNLVKLPVLQLLCSNRKNIENQLANRVWSGLMSTSGAFSSERFSKHCARWCVKNEIVRRVSRGGEIRLKYFPFRPLPHLQFDTELIYPHCHWTKPAVLPEGWHVQVWVPVLPCYILKELFTSYHYHM